MPSRNSRFSPFAGTNVADAFSISERIRDQIVHDEVSLRWPAHAIGHLPHFYLNTCAVKASDLELKEANKTWLLPKLEQVELWASEPRITTLDGALLVPLALERDR